MYAPFGAGVLVGPAATFADGDPFLAGGGAVDLVDLDEVVWTEPPEREEAGSPNVVGAVALGAALDDARPHRLGRPSPPTKRPWPAGCRPGWPASTGSASSARPSTPRPWPSPPSSSTASPTPWWPPGLSAEWGIGVRHGCFCAHPYLIRLLGLSPTEIAAYREQVLAGDHPTIPGAVRASCGISTTAADVDALLAAVAAWPATPPADRRRRSPTTRTRGPATSGP